MNYKEVIIKSLEKYKTEEIKYLNPFTKKEEIQKPKEKLPICFGTFLQSMCIIIISLINNQYENGLLDREPTIYDLIYILSGDNLLSAVNLSTILLPFIEWLIEQEAEQKDIKQMWYEPNVLIEMYNKFIMERDEE